MERTDRNMAAGGVDKAQTRRPEFVFSNAKAGMAGVDKAKVNKVIYDMSKNSSYFKQAQLQDEKLNCKVVEMKEKLAALRDVRKAQLTRQADRIAAELEAQRELDSVCLVVDMDMFYAAVEIRDRPELASKPVAVGGESMISTTNYHARLKGVRSAMPGFIGRKLCPELVFVKPDYEKYGRVAEKIREIFREYDPRMRSYSLDEALLNVTKVLEKRLGLDEPTVAAPAAATQARGAPLGAAGGAQEAGDGPRIPGDSTLLPASPRCSGASGPGLCEEVGEEKEEEEEEEEDGSTSTEEERGNGRAGRRRRSSREERRALLFEGAQSLAEEIRGRIKEATKLTASVGVGPNFMLAKIASDWNKPDGQMCIRGDRAEVLRFLHDLPVRKIGGVGKVQEKCLREALGVVTCGDLFRERAACLHVMTPHTSRWLIKVALGIASAEHDVATEQAQAAGAVTRKQISKERTFGELSRPQDLLSKCREICDSLAAEMSTKGLEAKTVGLKIKTVTFQVRTLDSTGQTYASSADDLYTTAAALLQREIRGAPGGRLRLRLMGIKASGFRGQAGAPILPGQVTLDGFLAAPKKMETEPEEGGAAAAGGEEKKEEEDGDKRAVRERKDSEHGPRKGVVNRAGAAAGGAGAGKGGDAEPCAIGYPAPRLPRSDFPKAGAGGSSSRGTVAAPNVTCPVCGEELGPASNAALNRHLDACLGMPTPVGGAGAASRKRAKISAAGIERFLAPRERT